MLKTMPASKRLGRYEKMNPREILPFKRENAKDMDMAGTQVKMK